MDDIPFNQSEYVVTYFYLLHEIESIVFRLYRLR